MLLKKNFFALNTEKYYRIESIFFMLMCIIGILPLLLSKYYVTLDGPAHLYNANIIKELVLDRHSEISNLFKFNTLPVPNWTAHFIMAFCNLFFPAFISEKIVFLIYFLLTPLFFRKLILHYYPQNRLLTYVIFLFLHNSLFYAGSTNMMLGFSLFFIIGFFYAKKCTAFTIRNTVFLAFLILLLYFSHIFILFFAEILLVGIILLNCKFCYYEDRIVLTNLKGIISQIKIFLIASFPAIILTLIYLLKVDSLEDNASYVGASVLLKWIIDIRPMLALCYCSGWWFFTHLISLAFIILLISNIYITIKNRCVVYDGNLAIKKPLRLSFIWFVFWFFPLICLFIFPNANVLSERLVVVFYFIFIIWIASLNYPKIIKIIAFSVFIFVHIILNIKYIKEMQKLSEDAEKIEDAGNKIEKNSLVLTLNYSDMWLHPHITGYLGANKALAVLENYEALLQWFPVSWNDSYHIEILKNWGMDNKNIAMQYFYTKEKPTYFSLKTKTNQIKPIPYVFVFGNFDIANDANALQIKEILNDYYKETLNNGLCRLYKLLQNGNKKAKTVLFNKTLDFDTIPQNETIQENEAFSGKKSWKLSESNPYTPVIECNNLSDATQLEINLAFYPKSIDCDGIVVIEFFENTTNKQVDWIPLSLEKSEFKENSWQQKKFTFSIPDKYRTSNFKAKTYVWNSSKKMFLVDNLQLKAIKK